MIDSPIQTRWNGIVSAPGSIHISTTFTAALTTHATSRTRSVRDEPITHIAHRLHPVGMVQLGPHPAHAHRRAGPPRGRAGRVQFGPNRYPTSRTVSTLSEWSSLDRSRRTHTSTTLL